MIEKTERFHKVQGKQDKIEQTSRKKSSIVFVVEEIIFKINAVLKMSNVTTVGK